MTQQMYVTKADGERMKFDPEFFQSFEHESSQPKTMPEPPLVKSFLKLPEYDKMVTLEVIKFLHQFTFASRDQLARLLDYKGIDPVGLDDDLDRMLEEREINSFFMNRMGQTDEVPEDAFIVYCMDFGGLAILKHFTNNDWLTWFTTDSVRRSGLVQKYLSTVEFYLALLKAKGPALRAFKATTDFSFGHRDIRVSATFEVMKGYSGHPFILESVRSFDLPMDWRDKIDNMSTYSFTKEYKDKQYKFNNPNETQDFAGLRDYFERENNFYLSDDFIRMMDELLHDNSFYFPEQVIKPVFGEKLTLKDQNGTERKYYTSRLPSDFKTGDKSRLFDEDTVKGFADMIEDKDQLTSSIGTDNVPSLIAQSQKPVESTDTDGTVTYALTEREVANGSVPSDAVPELWDYGFGSVLQYQADEKFSYIECKYTDVEVDIDKSVWIEGDDEDDGYWSDWSHHSVRKMSLDGISTTDELRTAIVEYLDSISTDTVR